jgi:hypothetical protein
MGSKQVFMPHDRSDRSLARVARVFIADSRAREDGIRGESYAGGLHRSFDRLKIAVEGIKRWIEQQPSSKSAPMIATTAISAFPSTIIFRPPSSLHALL